MGVSLRHGDHRAEFRVDLLCLLNPRIRYDEAHERQDAPHRDLFAAAMAGGSPAARCVDAWHRSERAASAAIMAVLVLVVPGLLPWEGDQYDAPSRKPVTGLAPTRSLRILVWRAGASAWSRPGESGDRVTTAPWPATTAA
jgi:predicted NBD/HSP70 family sugar kinase